jgi:signal transduction histidine kinase
MLAFLAPVSSHLGQARKEDRARERVQAFYTQARDQSLAVHALSQRLHPSKLGQLGLAAAVRGLCNELREHHGLEVVPN